MTTSRSPAAAPDGADDTPIIAAGGVVLDGEGQDLRVLVVHRPSYDDWSLPKGHVDAGETLAEAALREVREETGLEARIVREAGTTEHTVPIGARSGAKRVHWFLMRAVESSAPATPVPDPEVDRLAWWPIDVALERLSYANEEDLLRRIIGTDTSSESRTLRPAVDGSRATYRQEVTPSHVGQRISVRFLIDDEVSGPRPTDRVGRLLSCEEDGWIVVDRAGILHVVDPATIVASRLVPAHPRLAAEPTGTSEADAIAREAARVLLLDAVDRVLLVAHLPGDGRTVWTAPGGGLDAGESHEQAAVRELQEEIGLVAELGPWVWSRTATFTFRGIWLRQSERWFVVRTTGLDADAVPLDDLATGGARWWSHAELVGLAQRATDDEVLAPRSLPAVLAQLLEAGPPDEPVDVGP